MANVTRFDPFSDLDDLFKGFLVRPLAFEGRGDGGVQLPRAKVDVAEKNGAYVVTAELPGVKKEDIHVSIDGVVKTFYSGVEYDATGLTPGLHVVTVEFVMANHAPFNPRVLVRQSFRVV